MKSLVVAAFIALSFAFSNAAAAQIIAFDSYRGPFELSGKGADKRIKIPITDGDETKLKFQTNSSGPVILTYTANCYAHDAGSRVLMFIRVDGVFLNRGLYFQLCTGTPTAGPYAVDNAVLVAKVDLEQSSRPHRVEIFGQGINASEWGVFDTTISVTQ
jgi:hypothetical protein